MNLTLVLHNIRSTYNVGAILRTFEGFGGKTVAFSGYTPFPGKKPGVLPHLTEKIKNQIGKTALGAEEMLNCQWEDNIVEYLREKRHSGAIIIGLENNLNTSKVVRLSELKTALRGQKEAILVLGEEVSGIPEELWPEIDIFAEIPMYGQKESFNVSVAAGIALYELTNLQ